MEFFRKAAGRPSRAGILPGTFNPVTVAHLALAEAALAHLDEVVFVLPRHLPHKEFSGASFEQRIEMLNAAAPNGLPFSIAAADGGLFVEIARECRAAYGGDASFTFLCGRDAAERIAGWDYGKLGSFAGMLCEFNLLVAARSGEYEPPPGLEGAIRRLELTGQFDHVSATEVRERIARGEAWQHLVPEALHERVARLYR
jgi:nicotinate-nucleotide adenylyltransferase